MRAICQRCGASVSHWTLRQAELHIGELQYWKVQLCEACTSRIERAVREALVVCPDVPPVAREEA